MSCIYYGEHETCVLYEFTTFIDALYANLQQFLMCFTATSCRGIHLGRITVMKQIDDLR
jgi:hypothetical protein